ncbi:MAG: flavodoxin domain-containing protein [Methanomassiliicoccus sp.]|nr:flavodoxin domain-containing protein [Methanomassiliicoccus sp.]
MKGIVAYDTVNGNTKQVAEAIAAELMAEGHEVELVFLKDGAESPMGDVMFIGSPTRGMKMTKGTAKFLETLNVEYWRSKPIIMFDTVGPLSKEDAKRKHQLEMVGKGDKNAASKMRDIATARGLHVRPDLLHFAVTGMWGPLAADALSLAREHTKSVLAELMR